MRRTVPVLIAALLLPVCAAAASLDQVRGEAERFNGLLEQWRQELQAQSSDVLREAGTEVFPLTGTGDAQGRVAESDEDPVFLTTRVDGVPVVFRDIAKEAWFAPYVRAVVGEGIVSGYRAPDGTPKGLFGPADALTVEQLAKIAVQVAAADTETCGTMLKNVAAQGRWSVPFIRCAEQRGWAVFADGSVDVARNARRSEVVATLLQALAVNIEPRKGGVFTDVDSSVEFAAAIEMAAKAGVVTGDTDAAGNATGTFRPLAAVNRAEVAKIVTMALQVYGE